MDERMEALRRAAGNGARFAAEKAALAASAAGQAASAAGESLALHRELRRLERELQGLRQEVRLQLQAVGGMIYATHCGKPSDSEELLAKLRVIDGLEERIERLQAQTDALRRSRK